MRSKKTKANTVIYGIIGFPLKHTLSPHFQNAAFAYLGLDARYIPFETAPSDLKDVVRSLKSLGARGIT